MTDLTDFLLDRIRSEEAIAQAVVDETFVDSAISTGDNPFDSDVAFAEHFTPARVLADCAAKRNLVVLLASHGVPGDVRALAYRHLAAPFSDHPDFDANHWSI